MHTRWMLLALVTACGSGESAARAPASSSSASAALVPSPPPPVVASASASAAPPPSAKPRRLEVPHAALLTTADPAVRARIVAAGTSATIPSGSSPALVRGLAFGMKAEEAKSAFALGEWAPMGTGKMQVRYSDREGVGMIELAYPNEAAANRAVASWGKPFEGDSNFHWAVWTNKDAGIRAVLMPGDEGKKRTRLELLPFRPLAELLADGGELAFEGAHLLDVDAARLASLPHSREDIQMLPTELSSGSIPLRPSDEGYLIGIDSTYHHPTADEVRKLLVAHWGAAQEESGPSSCIRFAPRGGARARACLVRSQWQITISREK